MRLTCHRMGKLEASAHQHAERPEKASRSRGFVRTKFLYMCELDLGARRGT